MSNENLSEVYIIADRSSSMHNLRQSAIDGINAFRQEQQSNQEGECRVTLVLFNHDYQVLHDNILIGDMPEMSARDFVPNGGTALFDAIGKTVTDAVARHEGMDEDDRPDSVVVAIITDGEENRSREFCRPEQIQALIQEREAANWTIVYLSADINAVEHGTSIGLSRKSVVATGQDRVSTRAAYRAVSKTLSRSRFGQIGAENDLSMQASYDSLANEEAEKEKE